MITTASFCAGSSVRIMPPKRRAAAAAKAGGKKAKEEQPAKPKDAFTSAKEALLAAGPQVKRKIKVDEHCPLSGSGEVRQAMWDTVLFITVTCSKCMQSYSKRKIMICVDFARCMRTMTACSIRQTLDITITSFI